MKWKQITPWSAVLLILVVLSAGDVHAANWREQLRPFLRTHCVDCHSGAQPEGELDLSRLGNSLEDAELMRRWVVAHDRIAGGEMPPSEEPRPSKLELSQALAVLSAALTEADRARNDVVLRRLTRNEYENTVRDLFDAHVQVKDLLPQDSSTDGFDNVGEGLAVSAEASRAYLRAADVVLYAVFGPAEKPKCLQHKTNLLDQKTHDGKPFLAKHIGSMFRKTDKGLVIFQSGYCPTNLVNFARLRPPAGTDRGTIQVRAVQSEEPVTLRIYGGDTIVGRREKHLVGYYDVPPDKWTTIEFTDRLVQANGTFQPKCHGTKDTRKNADSYPEPGIEIGDITLEGPLEPWPPLSRGKLLGGVDPKNGSLKDAQAILKRLLPRAFRRKIDPEETEPYVALVERALADGRTFESA
ncbi:MAG: DUF1587 domain-containing protein, partial [Planctomycetales bacterium]